MYKSEYLTYFQILIGFFFIILTLKLIILKIIIN